MVALPSLEKLSRRKPKWTIPFGNVQSLPPSARSLLLSSARWALVCLLPVSLNASSGVAKTGICGSKSSSRWLRLLGPSISKPSATGVQPSARPPPRSALPRYVSKNTYCSATITMVTTRMTMYWLSKNTSPMLKPGTANMLSRLCGRGP